MLDIDTIAYVLPVLACVCTAACGMGSMRQQLHLDHDKIMELNIFTNIDIEQFLFCTCMNTNIDEIIVQ